MEKIDRIYMEHPFMGSRQITATLWHSGIQVNRKRVQRLMRLMGISSIAPSPNTTKPKVGCHKYPYLFRDLAIEHTNQVWATDITYIPMSKGFMYLVAILDLHSRKVLSAYLPANTMSLGVRLSSSWTGNDHKMLAVGCRLRYRCYDHRCGSSP
jgi:putative transposase